MSDTQDIRELIKVVDYLADCVSAIINAKAEYCYRLLGEAENIIAQLKKIHGFN